MSNIMSVLWNTLYKNKALFQPRGLTNQERTIGPSGVRALPLAAGTNEVGHYFGPSGVRALPLAAGTNEGGHYFGPSGVRAPAVSTQVATILGN